MWSDRQSVISIGCTLLGFILGVVFLAMPQYSRASATFGRIADLQKRIEASSEQVDSLHDLAADLAKAREFHESQLKEIPANPDMAGLMRALTIDIDGIDQTFTAGRSGPVSAKEGERVYALPLTVDMSGSFDSIFDLIRAAEQMPRLVRIASLRVERDEKREGVVQSTIGLEAIYEPNPVGEEG